MTDPITADTILSYLKDQVESKRMLNPKAWLESAFKLTVLSADEHEKLEDMRMLLAQRKLEILKGQEKRNVAAAELEVEASKEFRDMKIQEHKCNQIEEMVKLAKKNADQSLY
jgi:hypothetical protein